MVSETYKNSQDQALEERLSNMHEQMAGVTSRLDQTERALDLERATREDIIKAEVERRIREAEDRIRKEIEAEYADERAVMDKERQAIDRQREEVLKAFELMQQKLVTETEQKIRKAKDEAESHFLGKMAAQTEGFLRLFSEMTRRNNADIQSYLAKFKAASEDAQAAIGNEIKTRLERIFKNEQSKNRQIAELVRMIFTQKRERFRHADLYEAVDYTRRLWPYLMMILQRGYVSIDNNLCEQQMRPIAIYRNNSLFCGSHKGAERLANVMSLIPSCRLLKVNVYDYLCDVLNRIADFTGDLMDLLPHRWKPATVLT